MVLSKNIKAFLARGVTWPGSTLLTVFVFCWFGQSCLNETLLCGLLLGDESRSAEGNTLLWSMASSSRSSERGVPGSPQGSTLALLSTTRPRGRCHQLRRVRLWLGSARVLAAAEGVCPAHSVGLRKVRISNAAVQWHQRRFRSLFWRKNN